MIQTASEVLIKWRVANSNNERLMTNKDSLDKKLRGLETDIIDWDGAKILLEMLKNYRLEKRKDFILGIINQALRDIFQEDYRIDIQPKDMKGKSAASYQKYDILFYHNGIEIAKNDELLTSNGGGVLSIVSLFFKILIGHLYSKNKFFIFDESLSQVSPIYRQRLSLFLREFCDKYDFTLVVVSQTEELEEYANIVYEVQADADKQGVPVLKIGKTMGDVPQDNFFYTRVKNFQSIVDLSFIYKGFTIIRGPNNSGKSASLRAIDAILFNNFRVGSYPRKSPDGSKLTTEITFGYQGKIEEDAKEIGLKYKSNKVMFVIEGEEYYGKSLAADKLKEAVEEIGFRYIDTKKMYKNFKGPLKEQTERIAYSSQHDGLFLIGAKVSDSEKIFSFLFNTEAIALAIQQAKEALLDFNKEHKEIQDRIYEIEKNLRSIRTEIDYYLKLYYVLLIQEFQSTSEDIIDYQRMQEYNTELIQKIQNFTSLADGIVWLAQSTGVLTDNRNKTESNNINQNLIKELLEKITGYNDCSQLIGISNTRLNNSNKLDRLNQMIPRIQSLDMIDYWINTTNQLNDLKHSKQEMQKKFVDLNEEYKLQTCSHCQGIGVEVF